jgi:hypothetical protein
VNNRYYIGKHQTKNIHDEYFGSGKLIKAAIKKYGIENFKKEILFVFETEDEMNKKEAELVTEELLESGVSYNLCSGGRGGFGYINKNGLAISLRDQFSRNPGLASKASKISIAKRIQKCNDDPIFYEKYKKSISEGRKRFLDAGGIPGFLGKTHTEESKEKMRKPKNGGSKNSQFGTMWITNGTENKKIKKDLDIIPEGWYKGRR